MCLPRRINGRLIWTEPRFITTPSPEEHILRWVSQALSENGVFFDVGAHCGWISMAAAHRVGRSGRVVAFEPSSHLFNVLNFHKRANRITQLEIVGQAVSNANAESVPFFLVNGGLSYRNSLVIGEDSTPYVAKNEKTKHEAASLTLDNFVEKSALIPHLIKIDVEGAELLVLRGAEEVLRRFRPQLIIGVHPYWLPKSDTVEDIFFLLDRHGYEVKDRKVLRFDNSYLADYWCVPRRNSP